MSTQNHILVRPEHLNQYGYLFGGYLLQWVDEFSWIAASLDHPHCQFVTIAMDKVEFKKSVREGTILKFRISDPRPGTTSVQYTTTVLRDNKETGEEEAIFSTTVTFVRVDENGHKIPISD